MTNETNEAVSDEDLRKGLESIFSGFLEDENRKAQASLSECADDPAIIEATEALQTLDYRKFHSSLLRKHDRIVSALIKSVHGDNHQLTFLLSRQDYVGRHLRNLFTDFEGSACCADKERTVMRALLRHYYSKKPIEFDYGAEYTYMLPEIVFRDHDGVIAYFEAVYSLYYGNPKKYLTVMVDIAQRVQAAKAE